MINDYDCLEDQDSALLSAFFQFASILSEHNV